TSANVDSLFANSLANVSMNSTSFAGIDTTAGTFTYSTNVPATTLGLNKLGANTLILSGSNSYTGGTTLTNGILSMGSANALGTSGTISFLGGTLQYTASNTTDYSARFSNAA